MKILCLRPSSLALVTLFPFAALLAQQPPGELEKVPQLSPTEAYHYAMQPFLDARSAPNDMTDADQWALGLGVSRARQECEAIAPTKPQGEDLLAFGKLCVFGRDLGPAEDALIDYLALSNKKDEKTARLLLTRVFLQTESLTSAESQLDSLTGSFPYDADLHWAIDLVLDAAWAQQGKTVRMMNINGKTVTLPTVLAGADDLTARLNALQLPFVLKALAAGGTLTATDNSVNAAQLTRDALRCAEAMRQDGKTKDAADLIDRLKTLTAAPEIAQTAARPAIEHAFARYALEGQSSRVKELRGTLVGKAPAPGIRSLSGKTTVMIAFSLGSPQFHDVIEKIAADFEKNPPKNPIQLIAITSYASVNGEDEKSDAVLRTLQVLQTTLPLSVPMMIVPDTVFQSFAIDAFPAAIITDATGRIVYLDLFSGTPGSIAQLVHAAEQSHTASLY